MRKRFPGIPLGSLFYAFQVKNSFIDSKMILFILSVGSLYPSCAALSGKGITLSGSCFLAVHRVSFCCIFIQLSTEVFVALLIPKTISGLNEDFSFMNYNL